MPQKSFVMFVSLLAAMIAVGIWAVVLHEAFEHQRLVAVASVIGVAALLVPLIRPQKQIAASGAVRVSYWVCAALLFPWAVLRQYFGKVTVNSVLFHLNEGVTGGVLDGTVTAFIASGVLIFAFLYAIYLFLSLSRHANVLLIVASACLLMLNPVSHYVSEELSFWVNGPPKSVKDIAVDPVITKTPGQPRNLVIVYLEGIESTYKHPVFGNVYDPIADLSENAVSFTNINQLPMTGWSVACLVGSQCGLPTVRRGVRQGFRLESKRSFMPNRICLGDVLSQQGYQVEMLLGADAAFGGFEAFLNSHSYDNILDTHYMTRSGATDTGAWGYQDGEVFKTGLARLEELEQAGRPYVLSLFTIGPHGPDGFVSKECRTEGIGGSHPDVLIAVECTARLARDFVTKARELTGPSTLFLILSDHLAHAMVSASAQLEQFQRRNTVMLIGESETREIIEKAGTMIDVYPTVLEALGYELKGRRAGLGVSLFSDVASFGADGDQRLARQRLRHDVGFAQWLWSDERNNYD